MLQNKLYYCNNITSWATLLQPTGCLSPTKGIPPLLVTQSYLDDDHFLYQMIGLWTEVLRSQARPLYNPTFFVTLWIRQSVIGLRDQFYTILIFGDWGLWPPRHSG